MKRRIIVKKIERISRETLLLALALLTAVLSITGAVGLLSGYLIRWAVAIISTALASGLALSLTYRRKGGRSVALIGPAGTGKTVLLAALFYEATRSRQFRLRVQQGEDYLHSIVSPLFRAEYPPRTSKSVFETVALYISRGRRPFDQTVTISTIDYAGEWIERFADDVLTFATIESDYEHRLESMLAVADALIIVLPSDLASSEVSELSYKKILDAIVRARDLSPRRKLDIAIAVVVTKSDLNEKELVAGPEPFATRLSIFYDTIRSLTRPDMRFFFSTSILPSLEGPITFGVADLLDWFLYET